MPPAAEIHFASHRRFIAAATLSLSYAAYAIYAARDAAITSHISSDISLMTPRYAASATPMPLLVIFTPCRFSTAIFADYSRYFADS